MRSVLGILAVTLVGLGIHGGAHATLVKCRGEQGSVIYQDAPCPPGMELRNFDTDPPALSVVPGLAAAPPPVPAANASSAARTRASDSGRHPPKPKSGTGKAAERRFIRTGMSEAEVIRRIGKPEVDATTQRKQGKSAKLWSYLPAPGDPDTITTITLAGGLVTGVERKIVR